MRQPPRRIRRALLTLTALVASTATTGLGATAAYAADPAEVPDKAEEKFTAAALETLSENKTGDFWIRFADRADLAAASAVDDLDQRRVAVYEALTTTAAASQQAAIEQLDKAGVRYRSHWITNAILVEDGTLGLAEKVAAGAEVLEIRETIVYRAPEPVERKAETGAGMGRHVIEWGIDAINADDVWQLGYTGQGITVANIDSGVDGDHPALLQHYRGYNGGNLSHDYNWFDATGACDDLPCDTDGHGSHTMGTMVGDDGAGNQIGVAPGANWVAANGCDTCADQALIDSGEWILAPTKADGSDPDPTQAPDIVNNSWGSRTPSNDPFMEDISAAWTAAGIFGAWSNGNSGELGCESSGSPGSRTLNYSVGAYDAAGEIAEFSGRGPGQDGEIKPSISAPGVNVRSALNNNNYGTASGTSMSSPHLAGAVALLWSAAPTLVGDVEATRALLDDTAVDVADTSCGGTADDNNVWGEGKLDAAALIAAAPIENVGTLAGTVTDEAGEPVAGAAVSIDGPTVRDLTTDDSGAFSVAVEAGDYTVSATAFGYLEGSEEVSVSEGETTDVALTLAAAPSYTVSGTVTLADTGEPMAGATVTLSGPFERVVTGADGAFSFADVPQGTYTLTAEYGGCAGDFSTELTVDEDLDVEAALEGAVDAFGYTCDVGNAGIATGSTLLPLSGDDVSAPVDLPFDFPFYGDSYSRAFVASNGYLNFLAAGSTFGNAELPRTAAPNAAIYPFWDDLRLDDGAEIHTGATEVGGSAAYVIEWRNIYPFGEPEERTNFSVTLVENGDIILGYGEQNGTEQLTGTGATVGIENAAGTVALMYSHNASAVTPGMSLTFTPPAMGVLTGTVTDANDGLAVAGATVTASSADGETVEASTAEDGSYTLHLALGTWEITVEKDDYVSRTVTRTFDRDGQVRTFSPALRTATVEVTAEEMDWVLREGESRTATFTVTNNGTAPLEVELGEQARSANGAQERPLLSQGAQRDLTLSDLSSSATSVEQAKRELAGIRSAAAAADTGARTAKGLYTAEQLAAASQQGVAPDAVGDVLASWPSGLSVAWGIGATAGEVWVSDPEAITNTVFTESGEQLASYDADWAGTWNGDLAFDSRTGRMCQVNVGGDNAIHCMDSDTGEVTGVISGSGWTATSQRGLAYNPTDDVFYIGGWNEGVLYTVAGTTHDNPGATLATCEPEEPGIAGLGYNPTSGTVWMVPSAASTYLYQLSPEDCATVRTVAWPTSGEFPGAGLEVSSTGALWAADQLTGEVLLIDVGDPQNTDVGWLSTEPTSTRLRPGESAEFTVTVDTTGLEPGVYGANVVLNTNAGRTPTVNVPVDVVVSAYQVGVNAGGGAHTDADEFGWFADQAHVDGGWGWVGERIQAQSSGAAIGGTEEDPLFQSRRMGAFSYVFDDAPAGTYRIELGFAEFQKSPRERNRVFDVLVNGSFQLVEKDVAAEVGGRWADVDTLVVEHSGGDLTVEFRNRRSYQYPIVNALKVEERGDL